MLSVKNKREPFTPMALLRRTGQRSPEAVLGLPGETAARVLGLQPEDLTQTAIAWGKVADRLPPSMMTAAQRLSLARAPLPAQQGWPRAAVVALTAARKDFPGLTLPEPGPLADLLSADVTLRAVHAQAAQAKDGALDLRAITGAFGWFQISLVLDWLRDHQDDPDYPKILEDFTPMLVILSQVQTERTEDRQATLRTVAQAEQEAAAALDEARVAENQVAFAQGKPLPREDLVELAEREAAPPAKPPKARKQKR
jgi:hypothetical protein